MQRPWKTVLLALFLSASAVASAAEYKQGEVIVKYKDGIRRNRAEINVLYNSVGVKNVRRYSKLMKGLEHLTLAENQSVEKAVAQLSLDPSVEYVQPNYLLYMLPIPVKAAPQAVPLDGDGTPCWAPGIPFPPGCTDTGEGGGSTPANPAVRPKLNPAPSEVIPPIVDPDLAKAWGMKKINATGAWSIHRGSKAFVVADIDTGLDYNHPDISFNVWRNPAPSASNDIAGFDFVHNDGLPFDDQSHGTHTGGTIGSVGGNGVGISGVSQQVSLMALKFITSDGSGTTADAIRAIDYAIQHGAKVLSNSWGGKGDSDNQALRDSIDRAQKSGVLFVAAAGNDSADNDSPDSASYPAAFNTDNMISVAATDEGDGLAYFSNYGKATTHLAAPGNNIYSTVPGGQYKSMSGTSMACPHVAGAAALLWSKHPDWDYKKVKQVLISTVDPLPSLADKVSSGGRLNILKALQYQ